MVAGIGSALAPLRPTLPIDVKPSNPARDRMAAQLERAIAVLAMYPALTAAMRDEGDIRFLPPKRGKRLWRPPTHAFSHSPPRNSVNCHCRYGA